MKKPIVDVLRELRLMVQPLDPALESGIISKDEGDWYRLHVPINELPDYLDAKIREVSRDRTRVKFYKTSRAEKLLKKYGEKLPGS
jgi:hypothetical protein